MNLLTQIKVAYPDNTVITRNADVGLAICEEVTSQAKTPVSTPGAAANPVLAIPQPQPSAPVAYSVIVARINVRAGPAGDSPFVRYAVKDEILQVVNITYGWAQLSDGTFVLADFIRPATTGNPAPPTPVAAATPASTPTP